jgi:hypothetical protein
MVLSSSKFKGLSCWQMIAIAAFCAGTAVAANAQSTASQLPQSLHDGFVHPAADARPIMRWWWFGPAVVKPELEKELVTMKNAGIGGVEIQPVYPMMLDDESKGIKNLKYMSPEFLDAVSFANQKARSLGLRVDITLGSGWPYGGPSTSLAEAAGRLRVEFVPITHTPVETPKLAEGETLIAAFAAKGTKEHFDAASAVRFDGAAVDPPADGSHVAIFFIQSHTRQAVKRAAYGAEGFVLDHMARQAIETHLNTVADPLVKAFGSQPPYSVFSDSLEVYGADWTPAMATEFQKRRGYDLIAHLPELAAGSTPQADAIRHDWGVTMSDLVRDNYLTPLTQFAEQHGTKFRSQTYGLPPVVLADEIVPALPEGEGPQWRSFSFTRWASSANHLVGNNVTSAETWTWLHSPVFRATPLDMKVEADRMFLEGVNQFVGHGWPYSPVGAGEPGWSLYAAAVFNSHNPWFGVMPDITAYLTRMSWLLRQGKPANDVAILLPEDDAQASFSPLPGDVSVTGEMRKRILPELMSAILDAGYNVDYVDAKMIDKLGSIPYPLLVIPPTVRIPLAAYKKIESYAAAAGTGKVIAIGTEPTLAPGLKEMGESKDVASITDRLFTAAGHKGVSIASVEALPAALHAALSPDLDVAGHADQLGFIHRKLASTDIYYVVNSGNKPIDATVAFRGAQAVPEGWGPDIDSTVALRAKRPFLQAWDPDSGRILFTAANHPGKRFALKLAPYESRVFILSAASGEKLAEEPATTNEKTLANLSTGWTVRFDSEKMDIDVDKLASWTEMDGRKFFSGVATYTKSFTLDAAALKTGRVLIDFGIGVETTDPRPPGSNGVRALLEPPLREAAIVKVNGKTVGSLWHPPYRIDISGALNAGANSIEVQVANTAINRMAGDPPRDFTALYAKYGKRFEMQDIDNLAPLPSGMLGPVKLVSIAR